MYEYASNVAGHFIEILPKINGSASNGGPWVMACLNTICVFEHNRIVCDAIMMRAHGTAVIGKFDLEKRSFKVFNPFQTSILF